MVFASLLKSDLDIQTVSIRGKEFRFSLVVFWPGRIVFHSVIRVIEAESFKNLNLRAIFGENEAVVAAFSGI